MNSVRRPGSDGTGMRSEYSVDATSRYVYSLLVDTDTINLPVRLGERAWSVVDVIVAVRWTARTSVGTAGPIATCPFG